MKPPRGTHDLLGSQYLLYETIKLQFCKVMQRFGFEGVQFPILESGSLYRDTAGITADIIKEMYKIEGGSDIVLRPEGTASCIRALVAGGRIDETLLRAYYCGPMFRYNRPQKGRFREFTHLGCEALNQNDPHYDVELIHCLVIFLKSFQVDFKLHINSVGSRESLLRYSKDLYKFLSENQVLLSKTNQDRLNVNVLRVLDQLTQVEKDRLGDTMPKILDYLNPKELEHFSVITSTLTQLKVDYIIDQFIIRGLDYYSSIVFEAIHDNQAVAAGGRYVFDKGKFGINRDIRGIGWAVGLDRIVELVQIPRENPEIYMICTCAPAYTLEIAAEIRNAGKIAISFFGAIKDCFKKASSIGAKYIVHADEIEYSGRKVRVKSYEAEVVLELSVFYSNYCAPIKSAIE